MVEEKSSKELAKELGERNKEIRAELAERRTEGLETGQGWVFWIGRGGDNDEK